MHKKYSSLKSSIISMANVMINNYNIYCYKVWEESKKELLIYSNNIQKIFDNDNICEKLEILTGITLNSDFIASFCNSIDGGAEAIDISETQDIFGIGRNYDWAKKFISHEYIIYLLKQVLSGTTAFTNVKYWIYTECLAEFYLSKIIGETGLFKEKYIFDFYKEEYRKNNKIKAYELYEKAIKIYLK